MSLMTPQSITRLGAIFERTWRSALPSWQQAGDVVLHYAMEELLCRAVCEWTGIRLSDADARERTREFSAMIDGAGTIGPRNWRGLALRHRTERWTETLIENVRHAPLARDQRTPIETIALHRDENGQVLSTRVARVELLNILRPTVAVARFITFAALALHNHPQYREKLRDGGEAWRQLFTMEVRRFYPFFPLIGGNATEDFEWNGYHIERGTWVLLDMHGTNHDPRIWNDPYDFRPERFENWQGNAYAPIPQGAGDHATGHRCPGEWITEELVRRALHMLVSGMQYSVPQQDLSIDMSRMPAIPASRLVINDVRSGQ